MTEDVQTYVDGNAGRIRLSRPKALHALNTAMCTAMFEALGAWQDYNAVKAVLLDHAPSPDGDPKPARGFCAGGDIRMLAESGVGDGVAARAFLRIEYRLNHRLFTYAKPVVAFMDGITMGGGVGISQPARYRVATENTKFAMPETAIGLFPDVGGGWYLSRLPGRVGEYLALTGARLDGADCLALGLATHFLPADRLEEAKAAIRAAPHDIEAILARCSAPASDARIAAFRGAIDRHFAHGTVEEIMASLRDDADPWAAETLGTLGRLSPQALKVSLRLVREGRQMPSFADEMRQEFAIASRMAQRPDFAEGVRAVIVDKDNAPRWSPATLEGVTDDMIDALFAPLPAAEAWTPVDPMTPSPRA